jgi:hypothetical protein
VLATDGVFGAGELLAMGAIASVPNMADGRYVEEDAVLICAGTGLLKVSNTE